MGGGSQHCTEGSDQDHPQEKEMQKKKKAKCLSEEAFHKAEKRREMKGKGKKQRYIHPNADGSQE